MADKVLNVCLAGNPNCGKTTLFNSLTGSTAYVGNWPGVTVEKREGKYKSKEGLVVDVVDLPGIYSLSPYTPEEVVSRNFILEEHPDVVINVLDATNLERNLYMTTQILEMDVPVVIALNMMDAVENNGMSIDADAIANKLGVKVVKISALRNKGLDELMAVAAQVATTKREGKSFWDYGEYASKVDEAVAIYKKEEVSDPLFHAIKALEGDEIEAEKNKLAFEKVKELGVNIDEFEANSADKRYKYITSELAQYRTGAPVQESKKLSTSDKIDKVLTNKWAAIPILLVLLWIIFHITFASDLLYMHQWFGLELEDYPGFISFTLADGETYTPFAGLFYTGDGVNSIGEFFHCLAGDNETGILGLICLGIKQLLLMMGTPDAVIMVIYDGILNGVAAVVGFVPQILILFLFFSILEDSGYMARVAFVLDRIFRRFGVSGRAFLPMIMGLGCGVPAMVNTRTLNSDKERIKTIRVIPYFTCGAKADILAAVSASVALSFGWNADLFTMGMYVMGFVMAVVVVILMNKTTQREEVPPFIMELPAYHMPQPKAVAIHVWDKGKHFLKKAGTIILISTIVITMMENLTWDWRFIPAFEEATLEEIQALGYASYEAMEASSMLSSLGKVIMPLFTPIGFGAQLNSTGWIFGVATIQGIVAKENVTGTLTALAGIVGQNVEGLEDGDAVSQMFAATGITAGGIMGFTVFNLLTIPCFASVGTAKGELPTKKSYIGTILFWLLGAYVIASLFYLFTDAVVGNFGLVAGIIVPIVIVAAVVGTFFFAHLYDKKMRAKEALAA